jgi:hypothetical protein
VTLGGREGRPVQRAADKRHDGLLVETVHWPDPIIAEVPFGATDC